MMHRFDSIIFSPDDFDKHVQEFIIHLQERTGLCLQGTTDAYVLFYDSQACPDGENCYFLENRISRKKVSLDGIEVSAPVHFPDVSQTIHPIFQTKELRDKIKKGSLLALPLVINDEEPFGVAFLYSSTAHAFTDDSIDSFAKIVRKNALKLQNALVLASSLPYIQAFQNIRKKTHSIFYAGDVCHLLVQEITRLLPAPLCCIWFKDKEQNNLKPKAANITSEDFDALAPLLEDACRRAVAKDGHPRTNSITIDKDICARNGIALAKHLQVNSLLAIPIFESDDWVVGVVEIYSEENSFSASTILMLTNWINEIFAKFGNGILASGNQSLSQQEQETITLDIQEILSRTRQRIQGLLDIEDCFIMFYNPKTEELKYIEATDSQLIETPTTQSLNAGIAGYVVRSGFSEYIPKIISDKRWADYPDDPLKRREKEILGSSALCAPLIADGQRLGVIFTTASKGGSFTSDDHDALNQIASEVAYLIKANLSVDFRDILTQINRIYETNTLFSEMSKQLIANTVIGISLCAFWRLEEDNHFKVQNCTSPDYRHTSTLLSQKSFQRVINNRQILLDENIGELASQTANPKEIENIKRKLNLKSHIVIPIITKTDDTVRGVLECCFSRPAAQSQNNLSIGIVCQAFADILAVSIELAERERALQEILQMERITMVGQMAAGILHDIRTPLSYIGAAAGNIQKCVNRIETNNEQFHNYLEIIKEQATEINLIRRDIEKTIAGLEPKQGEPKFEKAQLDIKDLITNAFVLVKAPMKEDKSEVQLDFVEEEIKTIRAAKFELEYVFQNLIKNSLEAFRSNTGQIKVKIRKRVLEDKNYVQIIFEDNAGGMPSEKFEKIQIALSSHFLFKSEKPGGVGIGLKRSKDIVERQCGRLELKNVPGKGFIVTILLPYD